MWWAPIRQCEAVVGRPILKSGAGDGGGPEARDSDGGMAEGPPRAGQLFPGGDVGGGLDRHAFLRRLGGGVRGSSLGRGDGGWSTA